jgi:lipopolysaccharide transport system permease protein
MAERGDDRAKGKGVSRDWNPMIETTKTRIASMPEHEIDQVHVPTGTALPAESNAASTEIVIRPQSGWISVNWKEMIAHRELLAFLIWRDISVRYKQTILGSVWAVLQPLLLMLIFTFIFGRFVGKNNLDVSVPYPLFIFAGLIPWTLFSQGYPQAALSLVGHQNLLSKVYFPRLFIPVAAAAVFVVDLAYSLGIYAVMLAYYRVTPSWTIVFLPLLIGLTLVATLSLGVMLSALTVFYRDIRHVVPFLTQILMFVTPVIYPLSALPARYHGLLALNPMFGIVVAYRAAIFGGDWHWQIVAISTVSAIASFLIAVLYFRRTERLFADFV